MENLTDSDKEILREVLTLYVGDKQDIIHSTGQILVDHRQVLSNADWEYTKNTRLDAVDAVMGAGELAEKLGIKL